MRANRKKPKVVPARKPIAKATNDIAHGVSKSGARISCACGPIICSYAPARRRGDENAVSGHLSSRQYAFRRSACWVESCRFVFPIQLKNSVRLENCDPQVAATVVPFGRL